MKRESNERIIRRVIAGKNVMVRTWASRSSGLSGPVVLVHGLAVTSRYFKPVAERLSAHFDVFAPDFPGWGFSRNPDRFFGIPDLSGWLLEFMNGMHLDRANLVGNSLGCQVLVDFCCRYPEWVNKLVLIGPTIDPAARNKREQMILLIEDVFQEPLWLLIPGALEYLRFGLRRLLFTLQEMIDDPIAEKLACVSMPALVMRGSHDPVVSQDWADEVTKRLKNGRQVVISGGTHGVHASRPDEVSTFLTRFLEVTS